MKYLHGIFVLVALVAEAAVLFFFSFWVLLLWGCWC